MRHHKQKIISYCAAALAALAGFFACQQSPVVEPVDYHSQRHQAAQEGPDSPGNAPGNEVTIVGTGAGSSAKPDAAPPSGVPPGPGLPPDGDLPQDINPPSIPGPGEPVTPPTPPTTTPSANPVTPPTPMPPSPPMTTAPVLGDVPLDQNPNLPLGLPRDNQQRPAIIISRAQYVLSWNPHLRSINWAAWVVSPSSLGSQGRQDHFALDPELDQFLRQSSVYAVGPHDYSGSCFDRGHQVPSGDRTANSDDNVATFLMSNIAPQSPYLNRVIWEHLEERERYYAKSNGGHSVVIVSGSLFDAAPPTIGPDHDIAVPRASFKVFLVLPDGGSAADVTANTTVVAAILPNITSGGKPAISDHDTACADGGLGPTAGNSHDWEVYRTTLSELEAVSGFRLFPSLAPAVHDALAAKASSY